MTLLPRLFRLALLACLMAGCQPSAGKLPDDVKPGAVAGDAIEVTALDAPPAPVAGAAVAEAPTQGATPPTGPEDASAVPAPIPAGAAAAAGAAEGAAEGVTDATAVAAPEATEAATEAATDPAAEAPAEAAPVVVPKSDRQIACERKRGVWADAGSGLKVCVRKTNDSGKRCSKESDCEGVCLARSGTCAPADPMLGCNDLLQDDGSRATLCIE
jgi:type IV secretory pathway TrbL component